MASATQVQLQDPTLSHSLSISNTPKLDELLREAIELAAVYKYSITSLLSFPSITLAPLVTAPHPLYDEDELLALPLHSYRLPESVASLPRRKSARADLAVIIASLLFPCHHDSLSSLIRFEEDRRRLRAHLDLQRRYDIVAATRRNTAEAAHWAHRISKQGVWDPGALELERLRKGVRALPMPVSIARAEQLAPFFEYLAANGTYEDAAAEAEGPAHAIEEPYYRVPALEFPMGVLYEDRRLDLCKQVVGPDHIGSLMDSLRGNSFVRHFLLGNNIIGPVGARAIADFVEDRPGQIETWYLAGNCIDAASFGLLVDALVKKDTGTVKNVWLKRNPLGSVAADDVVRLIKGCIHLRTLDLDQTELGDDGVARIFDLLSQHTEVLPLRNIYLNGNGISQQAAAAVGRFLATEHCRLESIYLSCNPLTDDGALALAAHLPKAASLTRLVVQSIGIGSSGAAAICEALHGHKQLQLLELGQAYATQDLGMGYNYIEDTALSPLIRLVETCPSLEYLALGPCGLSSSALSDLTKAVAASPSLLYYSAAPIRSHTASTTAAHEETLERNVRARYGADVTYRGFLEDQKRWLVSDERDVRLIDSVYRTRDMGLARRGEMVLVKDWDEADGTLQEVMAGARGPVCMLRRR